MKIAKQTYLLQRGSLRSSNLNLTDFVRLDYMGYAEFEFGALPRALRRICSQFDKYELIDAEFEFEGKALIAKVLLNVDYKDQILKDIQSLINKDYRTKSFTGFDRVFEGSRVFDFWWSLDMDYMMYLPKEGYDLYSVIKYEVENWYDKLDPERKKDLRR